MGKKLLRLVIFLILFLKKTCFFVLQAGSAQRQSVKVGESIISLLLKLHSQLSGVPDSYNPDQVNQMENEAGSSSSSSSAAPPPLESRIGDGPFFISKLLKRMADSDPAAKENIVETRNKLWPRMDEDEQCKKENRDREEWRRRAREKQEQVLAEFHKQQNKFMETNPETGG